MNDPLPLFDQHIKTVCDHTKEALSLSGSAYKGIVFHSGTQKVHHADDQHVDFHSVPHFRRFAPVKGPNHLLLFQVDEQPKLFQVVPRDFWYEAPSKVDHPYANSLKVEICDSLKAAIEKAGALSGWAYVGSDPTVAADLGIESAAVEPEAFMKALDWFRAFKTPYEVECIREASRCAAKGHKTAFQGFAQQQTERLIHAEYLKVTQQLEYEVPYSNIIAWDANAATLHYQSKSTATPSPGAVLLIDAGANYFGYASDITRTYANDHAPATFRELLDRLDRMQQGLVQQVGPRKSYSGIHASAHEGIAEILCDIGVFKVSPSEVLEKHLTRPFLPHGVGHHLGIQVHDVGGHQINPEGEIREPSEEHPYLRTTRDLDVGHVVTIEPGVYFIPMLLEKHQNGPNASAFNWDLIDQLTPFGGIRIEDDIVVTESGCEDLTRPLIPGHSEA